MAYSTSNPPQLVSQGIGNQTLAIWHYNSADPTADVDGAGYITNGGDLGMKPGDLLFHRETDTDLVYSHVVKTVSSTAPGAVDLTNGTLLGSGTAGD